MKKIAIIASILVATVIFASFSTTAKIVTRNDSSILDEGTGRLKGFVAKFDMDFIPLEGAHVYIAGGHINLTDFNLSVALKETTTDSTGNYSIYELPAGEYTILVLRYGFGDNRSDKWVPGFRHTIIFNDKTTTENFALRPLARSRLLNRIFSIPFFGNLIKNNLLFLLN